MAIKKRKNGLTSVLKKSCKSVSLYLVISNAQKDNPLIKTNLKCIYLNKNIPLSQNT